MSLFKPAFEPKANVQSKVKLKLYIGKDISNIFLILSPKPS